MKKRMLDRMSYIEYILICREAVCPEEFSLIAEPGYHIKSELHRRISELRMEGGPYSAGKGVESDPFLLPYGAAERMIADITEEIRRMAVGILGCRSMAAEDADGFEALIASAENTLRRMDDVGGELGELCIGVRKLEDRISDRITDLTVTVEAGRLDALEELSRSLPSDELEAELIPPDPEELFGGRYRELLIPLEEADRIRFELLPRFDACTDFVERCSPISLSLSEAARDDFPVALGRICEAAGLVGNEARCDDVRLEVSAFAELSAKLCRYLDEEAKKLHKPCVPT